MEQSELAGPVHRVARTLLGSLLVSGDAERRVVARLVEVEAYAGPDDPASHAHRGRTRRNGVMFGPPGHAYVYLSYGMHCCLNVSCGPAGEAAAVLLRAAVIREGVELARERRSGAADRDLARGPGRLCRALAVARDLDGIDLCDPTGPLWLTAGEPVTPKSVRCGPRVGVSQAAERPWRFWVAGEPAVSTYRAGTRAARSGPLKGHADAAAHR